MIKIHFNFQEPVIWFMDDNKTLDISLANKVNYITVEGLEIEMVKRCYPELVNRASTQMFFGDIAKMIYANVVCQYPKV